MGAFDMQSILCLIDLLSDGMDFHKHLIHKSWTYESYHLYYLLTAVIAVINFYVLIYDYEICLILVLEEWHLVQIGWVLKKSFW